MLCSAVIEVRQHLCCANVFLKLSHSVTDSESIKIHVEKELIQLKDAEGVVAAEINCGQYFTLLTETFSNLVVNDVNISFRISVKDIGSLEQQQQQQDEQQCNNKTELLKFLLAENEEVSLQCLQCESTLCAPRKYQKIREFPSGAIDVSEFFCHHGPTFNDVLRPRQQDIFYGFLFLIFNNENVQSNIRQKESHVYCKRCKRYLGETMFDGEAVKLWSDSVAFKRPDDLKPYSVFDEVKSNMPVVLLLKVIKESSLPSPEPLLRNMHFTKVLLETTLPSRECQFLLVHILEKHLPVLRNKPTESNSANDMLCPRNVEIQQSLAFKLLYRLIEPETEQRKGDGGVNCMPGYPAIYAYWQQDINILKMNISPFLFGQLLNDLETNSLLLPEIYRHNRDLFTLSYIFQ